MMKKFAILSCLALISFGCSSVAQPSANTNVSVQKLDNSLIVSSHTNQTPSNDVAPVQKSATKTKWKQSGTPIDVSSFDVEIAKAESALKIKPKDETAKKTVAEAYLKRGVALTKAQQYASALGDYRHVLKYDEKNDEAKKWIDQIISIYDSINKEFPKEGEEPPPLPFKKAN
jgi:tetratricopeptide (TPR) repeat protein